jgi:hypothetical protein
LAAAETSDRFVALGFEVVVCIAAFFSLAFLHAARRL